MNDTTHHTTRDDGPPRNIWDPAKSDLVEQKIAELVELYVKGQLKDELRPSTLLTLSEDQRRFYHAAFKREERPAWAVERFPLGFESLVAEVNERTEAQGVGVINTKRNVPTYRKLPQEEREIIRGIQEVYQRGEIERAVIREELQTLFGIQLNDGQFRAYFPATACHASPTPDQAKHFEERVRAISQRLERYKKDLGLEFSIEHCLKGVIFERLIGCHLQEVAASDGVELKSQVKHPVVYRDLRGIPHTSVITDYELNGQIIEVKWRNSFQNIVTSCLPQLYSCELATGKPARIVVLYQHPCPYLKIALEENLRLRDEATEMGLLESSLDGRGARDMIDYLPAEALLKETRSGRAILQVLKAFESRCETASAEALQGWLDAANRIYCNPEYRIERLEVLQRHIESGEEADGEVRARLFGSKTRAPSEDEAGAHLRRLLMESTKRAEALLLAIYRIGFGTEVKQVDDKVLRALEELPEDRFRDICLDYLAGQEQRQQERLQGRGSQSNSLREEREVLAVFGLVQERARAQRLQRVEEHKQRTDPEITRVIALSKAADPARQLTTGTATTEYQHAIDRVRKQLARRFTGSEEEAGKALASTFTASYNLGRRASQIALSILQNIERALPDPAEPQRFFDLSGVVDLGEKMLAQLEVEARKFQGTEVFRVLQKLAKRPIDRRARKASRDEQDLQVMRGFLGTLSLDIPRSEIETIILFAKTTNALTEISHDLSIPLLHSVRSALAGGSTGSRDPIVEVARHLSSNTMEALQLARLLVDAPGRLLPLVRAGKLGEPESYPAMLREIYPSAAQMNFAYTGTRTGTKLREAGVNSLMAESLGRLMKIEAAEQWNAETLSQTIEKAQRDVGLLMWEVRTVLSIAIREYREEKHPNALRQKGKYQYVKVADFFDDMVEDTRDGLWPRFREAHLLETQLAVDVFERRIDQARMIGRIDVEMACEFLRMSQLEIPQYCNETIIPDLVAFSKRTDDLFSGLMMVRV